MNVIEKRLRSHERLQLAERLQKIDLDVSFQSTLCVFFTSPPPAFFSLMHETPLGVRGRPLGFPTRGSRMYVNVEN